MQKERKKDLKNTATALSTSEIVDRFGNAEAEFIKGYRGIDNQTGQKFAKGLKEISEHKINPQYAEQNIKQQAGYSAEVAQTSKDNAENIIKGSKVRVSRSDDLAQYGRNHNVVDRVQILDGDIIAGTEAQMKVVGNRDQLFKDITKPDGKFARYRGIKLEIPSEQYEGAVEYCKEEATRLRENAIRAEQKGNLEAANRLREQADNYDQLSENVQDIGMTTEEAIEYRNNPLKSTIKDIASTSHRAGLEGAKVGAAIGGTISVIQNLYLVAQGNKELDEAAIDVAKNTVIAAGVGYGTGATGSAIKSVMQQSANQTARNLANTAFPTMILNVSISLASSVKRFATGEIDSTQFLEEIGEKGSGMLSSTMMATMGQIAIPIPVVGAVLGGMIGYSLSSIFYQAALDSAKRAKEAEANYQRIKAEEATWREELRKHRELLSEMLEKELVKINYKTKVLFDAIENPNNDIDDFASEINNFAKLLGKELGFNTQEEFDDFMATDKPLIL